MEGRLPNDEDMEELVSLLLPISSAPRNGTRILVGDAKCGLVSAFWDDCTVHPLTGRTGMWMSSDGTFVWSEDHGGGPRCWRPLRLH